MEGNWEETGRKLGGNFETFWKGFGRLIGRLTERKLKGNWEESGRNLEGIWEESGRKLGGNWKETGRLIVRKPKG